MMEYSDAKHKRAVEIEAVLNAVMDGGQWTGIANTLPIISGANVERAKKALLPIYEPLLEPRHSWGVAVVTAQAIGASYLEAAADRMSAKGCERSSAYVSRDLTDGAKLERALGSWLHL